MGTGITSVLLFSLPYNGIWIYWISVAIFVLNVALFVIGTAITLLRYTLYPTVWSVTIRDPYQSMFLSCFPVGFATVINMIVLVCVPAWGHGVGIIAWGLWMVDAVISTMAALCLPFMLYVAIQSPLFPL